MEEQLKLYPNAEVTWAQEEHRNQGAWSYIKERLELLREKLGKEDPLVRYVGRKIAASTAVGSAKTHRQQLEELLADAFSTN